MKIITAEQNSPEWDKARLGRPTASGASRMITGTGKPSDQVGKYARELAADMYAGVSIDAWRGNEFTERGHEVEEEAASWYDFQRNLNTDVVGFVMDDAMTYGASPDRLVGDDGLLEIKCKPKGHMDALLYWKKHGQVQPAYRPQIAMQLLVTDRAWCDLLYYHPQLPSIIVRVERDTAMDAALLVQIEACIEQRDDALAALREIAGESTQSASEHAA